MTTDPNPSRQEKNDLQADVLIVGGGLVGGTLACALAQSGVSVVVVDQAKPDTLLAKDYDGRSSAISLTSQKVLEAAGIWPYMAGGYAPIEDIRVSDQNSLLFLHYDHTEVGDEPFGWICENRYQRMGIYKRLGELPEATLCAPCSVERLDRHSAGVEAQLDDGRVIKAQLAVAADGRGSLTRAGAGIQIRKWDYHQTGIVLTVKHEKPHLNTAQEHFLPSGPFAILPLPGDRSSIVWTEKNRLIPAFMGLDDTAFMRELKKRFGDFLGGIEVEGPRFAYPLTIQFADDYMAERLALVGDAAHGMHPIAGQGMNMGVRDVAALSEAIVEAKRLGLDIGAPSVLETYRRWRRFDNNLMLGLTDLLVRLFSNDIAPLRVARDLGMAAVNQMPPVKRFFMEHAMGTVGDLPKMMRGERL